MAMVHEHVQETRPAALAGKYYPAEREFLASVVDRYLLAARPCPTASPDGASPKAIIAPHGGYIFSGAVAGSAFAAWKGDAGQIERVVIIGPSHYYDFPGLALPGTGGFETPFGVAAVDEDWADLLEKLTSVRTFAAAHETEHSVEVQIPFLQRMLGDVKIVPLITGSASHLQVAAAVEKLWGGRETRFVISSDLSHYLDYGAAQRVDRQTAELIENLDYRKLTAEQACGAQAIRGFLRAALEREMTCHPVDLRNSGDTVGATDEVIGYGAFHFFED
jgi:MEMO1 family protein